MVITDRTRLVLPLILRITLVGAVVGAAYSYLSTPGANGAGFIAIERGLLGGGAIGCVLTWLNAVFLEGPNGEEIRNIPFPAHIALKCSVYLVVFIAVIAFAQWILPIPSAPGVRIGVHDILFFFGVSFIISFLLDLNRLLGQNVLLSFAMGRYFRPRVEERVFLIIDMKGSTAAAERLGEVDFHRLLNRFIAAISGPIATRKGEIHKYVGDELIATWPLQSGLKDARCLGACFGAMRRLAELRPSFEEAFGFGVEFRAGLHCGAVVVGEIGAMKKEIALSGDALNTAARIVDVCRERGETVLASAALLGQLTLPAEIAARALPPIELRGKRSAMELFVLKEAGTVESAAAPPPRVETEGAVARRG